MTNEAKPPWAITVAIVLLGIAAMALAVVEADHEALSSIFAFTGITTALFGLLLSRLEGPIEFGKDGFKAKLREVRALATNDGLTLEEKGEAVSDIFATELKGPVALPPALAASSDLPHVDKPFEWPAPSKPGAILLRHVPREFEAHVSRVFENNGWRVARTPRREPFDLQVDKDGKRLFVETRAARHLSTADIAQMVSRYAEALGPGERWVLAVPAEALSAAATRLAQETQTLEVLYVPVIEGH